MKTTSVFFVRWRNVHSEAGASFDSLSLNLKTSAQPWSSSQLKYFLHLIESTVEQRAGFLFGSDFYIHLNLHRLWTCCSFIFPMISAAASVFWEITFSLFGSAVKEITVFQHVEEQICSPLACVFRLDRCYVDDNTHSMPPFVNSEVTVRLSVLT